MPQKVDAPAVHNGKRTAPETVAPRVNVSFPFSKITVGGSDKEIATLATEVAALAQLVARLAPGPEAEGVLERTRALALELS